jgi:hypothetical protein
MELRKIAMFTLLAAMVAGVVAAGCAGGGTGGRAIVIDEPVQLTRTFEDGQTIKYKLSSAGEMAVAMQGFDRVDITNTEFKTTCTFSDTDTDEISMAMRFDRAAASITVGDQVLPQESVSALNGKTLEFSLAPNGQVLSFSGMGGEDYFEQGLGEMALMLHGLFPLLPEEPVTIGYTWQDDMDVPNISSATTREFVGETTYTVIGFKEKFAIPCVEIEAITDFEFEGKVEQQGQAWLMTGSGRTVGQLLISIEDGLILSSQGDSTIDLEGEGSTTAGAGASTTVSAGLKLRGKTELL